MRYGLFFKVFLLLIFFTPVSEIHSETENTIESAAPESPAEIKLINIKVDSYSFEPDKITVKVNEPLEIRLMSVTSIIPHNFSINYPEARLVIDKDIPSGEDVTITFTPSKPGKYEFYCKKKNIFANHRKKGMTGVLEVIE